MSPVTHFLSGWVIANAVLSLSLRDRGLVTVAAVIPDIDGFGIIPELITRNGAHPLLWFSLYHHRLHNLAFCVLVTLVSVALADKKWATGSLVFVAFHVHLLEDLLGARGPDGYSWPIPYLTPLSNSLQLVWNGQWALNAWPNILLTLALLTVTFYLA